ncbi:MAG TPA: hypothetical protein VN132_14200, partial [Bdellovibrio sp.]|nr:hypothetical protein [Bdellovibrio sp.]
MLQSETSKLSNQATALQTEFGGEELNGRATKTSFPRAIINHDLMLTKLRLRLEEYGLSRAWISEHVLRKKIAASQSPKTFRRMNVPDGLMGFETPHGNKVSYAIELELTAKSQKRYREIFKQYEKRNQLRAYWYVVRKQTIGSQILKA